MEILKYCLVWCVLTLDDHPDGVQDVLIFGTFEIHTSGVSASQVNSEDLCWICTSPTYNRICSLCLNLPT